MNQYLVAEKGFMTPTEKKHKCPRCKDTGWLDSRGPYTDLSYATMRPCPSCDAYENSEEFKAFRRNRI